MRAPRVLIALLTVAGCSGSMPTLGGGPATPYQGFLQEYAEAVAPAWTRWHEAAWRAHTEVVPGDYTKAELAMSGRDAWRSAASESKWVRQSRDILRENEGRTPPTPVERAAFDAVARMARLYPAGEQELIRDIDAKVGLQARFRRRATPTLDGEPVHPEELARRFATAIDTTERKKAWKAMLAPAADIKPTYGELRDLRNELAKKGGWAHHADAMSDPYGMTANEMLTMMEQVELSLRPLYQELHTWAREKMATDYDVEPPDLIPAHWLPSPVGDDWGSLAVPEFLDPEPALQDMGANKMVRQVEDFYTNVGLPPLPESVWTNSSLYPVPPGARVGKTQGSSTWDIDLGGDVRILMNARPTRSWQSATFRELAFAHAYTLRADAELPIALRQSPPGAPVGALGVWADLAASRPARMKAAGLIEGTPDDLGVLLHEALTYVPFVQFGAGSVVPFEYEVYAEGLAPGQMNSRWWGLLARHQGIFPPETRTERWADFLAVEALQDAPGHYSDHVLSVVLAFQLHMAVCESAGIDPRTGDLYGKPAFGKTFQAVAMGADVVDWRALIQQNTGSAPSADAMVRYFDPLYRWLQSQNASRTPTLPSLQ